MPRRGSSPGERFSRRAELRQYTVTSLEEFTALRAARRRAIEREITAFGRRLRTYRRAARLPQLALAEIADVDLAAVSLIERAHRAPNLGTLVRIARALGLPPAALIDVGVAQGLGSPRTAVNPAPLPRRPRQRPAPPSERARKARFDQAVQRQFGANLRQARFAAGLSQEELANRADLDRAAVSMIERGKRSINLRTLLRLADALELAPGELLAGIS